MAWALRSGRLKTVTGASCILVIPSILYPYQQGARFDGRQVMLPTPPQTINGTLYVPWTPLAELFGVRWRIVSPQPASSEASTASKARRPVARSGVEYSHRVPRHRL
jgi:hypothetical protein